MEHAYLFLITAGLCATYLLLYYLFPWFFKQYAAPIGPRSIFSVAIIAAVSLYTTYYTLNLSDLALANTLQHAVGGGFIMFLTVFLAVRDSRVHIDRARFLIAALLICLPES
jgi:hypothetical protein